MMSNTYRRLCAEDDDEVDLQFFSEYPAVSDHPLLLEWHDSATVSRNVWELVESFLEGISRLLGSGGGRKSVTICHCPWEV